MVDQTVSREVLLEPADNARLANLCGQLDEHLRQIERALHVEIANRGNRFRVSGDADAVHRCRQVLERLYAMSESEPIDRERVFMALQESGMVQPSAEENAGPHGAIRTRRKMIRPRGANQLQYVQRMREHDLTFGIGPAGTGKTYLAIAAAVEALDEERVRRIVLVRPAVEAGERLGFLPGDMSQKVDPFLRPMYDALYDTMGFEHVGRLIERQIIEVAPLAFMRGRSLNDAFVILDEAQNTSMEQMKMFLTRIGFGSRAVVAGDVTQTDLPRGQMSGLTHALKVLADVPEIAVCHFSARDVVRHPLVQTIVRAYDEYQRAEPAQIEERRGKTLHPDRR